ncbi:SH3 domain-containing protein [Hephaestia sp. CMS5P-6]|nr:SH3 domain-containing protein [Hephaestia mangrovi]
MTGRSVALDPRTYAVRPDLADVRLAAQVFAPHYAQPIAMLAVRDTPILASANPDAEIFAHLRSGDTFDVLEITTTWCWGQQPGGVVGYVARDALDRAAEQAA